MGAQDGVIIACALPAEQNDADWPHPMLDADADGPDLGTAITAGRKLRRALAEDRQPDPDATTRGSQAAQQMAERLTASWPLPAFCAPVTGPVRGAHRSPTAGLGRSHTSPRRLQALPA